MFEQMRQRLIEKAIRGQLVPQSDSEPEVEQIGEAPEDVPFEIPTKWKWVRIASVVLKHLGGGTPSKSHTAYWNGSIPWASVKDFSSNVLSKTVNTITQEGLNNSSSNLIPAGTIIVCTRISLGKIAINDRPIAINQDLRALFLSDEIDQQYFVYFYRSLKIKGAGTTVKGIKVSELLNWWLPLPPHEEQCRIVAKLQSLLDEIDKVEKAYNELIGPLAEQHKALILDKAMRGQLVPQLDSEPEVEQIGEVSEDVPLEIPLKWKWVKLENLSREMADGPFGSNLKKEHYTNKHEVRIIQLSNIGEQGWRDENVRYTTHTHAETIPRSRVNSGDIVIAKMMPAGRAVIVPDSDASYVLCSDAVKVVVKTELILTKFLNFAINSQIFKQQVYANVQGTTRVRTSLSKLKTYQIPVPPLNEQCRIVAKIEELFSQVEKISV